MFIVLNVEVARRGGKTTGEAAAGPLHVPTVAVDCSGEASRAREWPLRRYVEELDIRGMREAVVATVRQVFEISIEARTAILVLAREGGAYVLIRCAGRPGRVCPLPRTESTIFLAVILHDPFHLLSARDVRPGRFDGSDFASARAFLMELNIFLRGRKVMTSARVLFHQMLGSVWDPQKAAM